jgi:RNA polymerase sigma-70 factor, ECF subfamily
MGIGVDERVDTRELVERARNGDHQAWELLYRRAYPGLLAYAQRRLYGSDEARDAVGETMARAVGRIGRFTWQGGGFDAWLFGILRHVVLDAQRRSRRRSGGLPRERPLAEATPLDRLVDDEDAAAVRTAFLRLDPRDQEILELRVLGGLSADEVASVIGKRPGAVRMAQSRALDRLRQLMQEVDHAGA